MTTKPKQTRAQARERLAAERAAAAAASKRRDRMLRIGLVAIVVVLVAGIGIAVVVTRGSSVDTGGSTPAGVTATLGYPTGSATKPVLDIWEDFQCPNCELFETANRTQIEALATSGKAQVVYHTWNFLDSGNASNPAGTQKSSSRAAIAAGCAWDQGKFLQMHDQIYENQPAQETTGWTDAQLEQYAKTAGVADMNTFDQCLSSRKYQGFLTQVNAQADKQQITGTPTFLVGGTIVDTTAATSWADVGTLVIAAVDKAAGSS
jgi:protein-disulfide isomerase